MDREKLLNYHAEICHQARELMNLKNRDYAGNEGDEPFANFTRCESMGICETEQGFMVRVTDKMSRLSSFLRAGKMYVSDESFNDTIVDVINYMVLLSAYVSEKESQVKTYEEPSYNRDLPRHPAIKSNGFTTQRTYVRSEDC